MSPPTVWKNCRLLLLDPPRPRSTQPQRLFDPPQQTAVVVQDGVIVYMGGDDGAEAWAGSGAAVVDLGGRLVTPAFVDAHVHLVQTGQVMAGIDLSGARSREQVLELVARFARQHPGAVVVGQGWDEGDWPEPRVPERAELDRAGGGAAVYLARVDVHSAVVSTALLAGLTGLERETGYSDSGWLTQDAHHRCRAQLDSLFSDDERRAAARMALDRAAAVGIGSVHELGGPHLGPLEDLLKIREVAAELGMCVATYWGELVSEAAIAKARRVGALGLAGDLCVDGAIGSRTAALAEPYADASSRGVRYLSVEEIAEHVVGTTRAGLQAGFHCIGDDAVSASVEGFRRAAEVLGSAPIRAARHRLEHLEMLSGTDIRVLSHLGVAASMQPAFDAAWGGPGELYERRLGPVRAHQMNRLGSLHRAGVPLAFGSDSPVTPMAGWQTVRAATRHNQPGERLDSAAAFDAATRGGHWAAKDDQAGTVSVGSAASLAVWETPLAARQSDRSTRSQPRHLPGGPSSGLPELDQGWPLPACVLTMSRGRIVHHTGALAG